MRKHRPRQRRTMLIWYTVRMSDALKRTVCIKLDVRGQGAVLSETAETFNAAATWIARVCWEEGITNNTSTHSGPLCCRR
jgi:hypothetical protein